jgi:DNA (cytosine-5)-methyltransferase 1
MWLKKSLSGLQKSNEEAVKDTFTLYDAWSIREQLGVLQDELDLVAGGPPCQGFSINAPIQLIRS